MISRRFFSISSRFLSHENPLGLPRSAEGSRNVPPPQLPRMQRGLPVKKPIKDVQNIIAVSSAKGGVGKSTVAGTKNSLGFPFGNISVDTICTAQ